MTVMRQITPQSPCSEETAQLRQSIKDWIDVHVSDETQAWAIVTVQLNGNNAVTEVKSAATPHTIHRKALSYFAHKAILAVDDEFIDHDNHRAVMN